MSKNRPVRVLVAVWNGKGTAVKVLEELKADNWAGLSGIQNAAIVQRDKKDRLRLVELDDCSNVSGGALAAVIGALASAVRQPAAPDARGQTGGKVLGPDASAIVAVVKNGWLAEMHNKMVEAGAEVMRVAIAADVAEQVESGYDTAHTTLSRATAGDETTEALRAAGTDHVPAGAWLVLTNEGLIYTTTPPESTGPRETDV